MKVLYKVGYPKSPMDVTIFHYRRDAETGAIGSFYSWPYCCFLPSATTCPLWTSPPGCGRSVTAHEAQLRCLDEVDGDI
jgi:hypothetical protein